MVILLAKNIIFHSSFPFMNDRKRMEILGRVLFKEDPLYLIHLGGLIDEYVFLLIPLVSLFKENHDEPTSGQITAAIMENLTPEYKENVDLGRILQTSIILLKEMKEETDVTPSAQEISSLSKSLVHPLKERQSEEEKEEAFRLYSQLLILLTADYDFTLDYLSNCSDEDFLNLQDTLDNLLTVFPTKKMLEVLDKKARKSRNTSLIRAQEMRHEQFLFLHPELSEKK